MKTQTEGALTQALAFNLQDVSKVMEHAHSLSQTHPNLRARILDKSVKDTRMTNILTTVYELAKSYSKSVHLPELQEASPSDKEDLFTAAIFTRLYDQEREFEIHCLKHALIESRRKRYICQSYKTKAHLN